MNVENYSYVTVGISLEKWEYLSLIIRSGDFVDNLKSVIQTPFDRELPIMRLAQDLYNFITSYSSTSFWINVFMTL